MSDATTANDPRPPGVLDRVLKLFADVRGGEGGTALLLMLNMFLLLTSYYIIKTIDSFFWRGGDLLSSALVFVGAQLALQTKAFAAVNLALVVIWIGIVTLIAIEHRKLTGEEKAKSGALPEAARP